MKWQPENQNRKMASLKSTPIEFSPCILYTYSTFHYLYFNKYFLSSNSYLFSGCIKSKVEKCFYDKIEFFIVFMFISKTIFWILHQTDWLKWKEQPQTLVLKKLCNYIGKSDFEKTNNIFKVKFLKFNEFFECVCTNNLCFAWH